MRHEVQLRARGQHLGQPGHQVACVLDRTLRQRPVLQRQEVLTIEIDEVADTRAGTGPECTEATLRGRSGAVQEDERRLFAGQLLGCREILGSSGRAAVESSAGLELPLHLVRHEVSNRAGDIDAEYFQASNHPVADAAALPPEGKLRRNVEDVQSGGVAAGLQPEVVPHVIDARPQANPSVELHLDDIVWRDSVENGRRVALAGEADPDAVLDLNRSLRKRALERGWTAAGIRLPLAVNTKLLHRTPQSTLQTR